VQEVIRLLLQAIYEPQFKDTSHGFRPNRSCHTALAQIKTICKGTNWVIEGEIKGFSTTSVTRSFWNCSLEKSVTDDFST
jgi:retron-type reverse transcriptase